MSGIDDKFGARKGEGLGKEEEEDFERIEIKNVVSHIKLYPGVKNFNVLDCDINVSDLVTILPHHISSQDIAGRIVGYLSDMLNLASPLVTQALVEFTLVQGSSLRTSDAVVAYINSPRGVVPLTTLMVKEAVAASGAEYLRRAMRAFADYARRLLIAKPGLIPIGVRRCPELASYRTILFDYADGCLSPPLSPIEMTVLLKYRYRVLGPKNRFPDEEVESQTLD